jgi:hypothetical protein
MRVKNILFLLLLCKFFEILLAPPIWDLPPVRSFTFSPAVQRFLDSKGITLMATSPKSTLATSRNLTGRITTTTAATSTPSLATAPNNFSPSIKFGITNITNVTATFVESKAPPMSVTSSESNVGVIRSTFKPATSLKPKIRKSHPTEITYVPATSSISQVNFTKFPFIFTSSSKSKNWKTTASPTLATSSKIKIGFTPATSSKIKIGVTPATLVPATPSPIALSSNYFATIFPSPNIQASKYVSVADLFKYYNISMVGPEGENVYSTVEFDTSSVYSEIPHVNISYSTATPYCNYSSPGDVYESNLSLLSSPSVCIIIAFLCLGKLLFFLFPTYSSAIYPVSLLLEHSLNMSHER